MIPGYEEHMSFEELKKSLGEYAGFKWDPSTNSWTQPNGKQCNSPDFLGSLDSVFHWLQPHVKLIRIDFMGSGISPNGEITEWQVGIVSYAKPKLNQVYGFAENPSEALCRAIHNLISGKDGRSDIRVATDQ
jgi:hypothetical protein